MKMIYTVLFLLINSQRFLSAQPSGQYRVNLSIKEGMTTGKAFLRYFTENGPYLDSVSFTGGKFSIKGNVPDKLTIARLYLLQSNEQSPSIENTCNIWLEPGTINIIAEKKLMNAGFRGSLTQEQFSELQLNMRSIKQKNFLLDEEYERAQKEKDAERKDKLLNKEYPALFIEKQVILGKFIKKYPASLISAFMFEDFAGEGQINLAIVEPVYANLHDSIKAHPRVKKVAQLMDITKKTAPGMKAIEFSQTDTSGNHISLSSFGGKYLLIDFWAGWCVPCRAENPHLIKLYDRYRKRGFEILGVSLDGERKRWTQAIITDKLQWSQVSDLKIFDNEVAKLYGITSIPQNILVAPDGKIIEWNLKGTILDKKLAEIFKE